METARFRYFFRLVTVLALLFASDAHAKLKNYSLDELAPDQGYAGMAEASRKAGEWLAEARNVAKTRGSSLKDEVVKILNRELQRGVESYVSPDGKIRISDGHHKVIAARKLLADMKISESKVEFSADVAKDFRGDDWEKYVKWREAHHPTYFPEAMDKEHLKFEEIVAYYKKLPTSFDDIQDLPMRSATGQLFDAVGLKGGSFEPYVQFRLGEELKALGVQVKAGQEFSFATQKQIRDAVFTGRSSAKLLKLLKGSALEEDRAAVAGALDKAKALIAHQDDDALAGRSVEALYGGLDPKTKLTDLGVPLPGTQKDIAGLLEAAQERYASRVDQGELKDVLKALRDGEKLSGKQVKLLKEARKSALNLRSAIKLLGNDDAKAGLKDFRNFVTEFGNLNDKLADWDLEGKVPGSISKQAEEVLGLMDKNVAKTDIPAKTPGELAAFEEKNLSWLEEMLGKKSLTIGEYHDVRKMVRDYMGLLQLTQDESPDAKTNAVLSHLTTLSKRMGKLKDGLEIPTKESKALKFIQRPTKIDPDTRGDLETLVTMMKNETAPKRMPRGRAVSPPDCEAMYREIH